MKIRVLSYNIHRAIGFDRRFLPERISNILTEHDADIVLLQEVDEGAPRSRKLKLAKELADALGYQHFVMGHNVTLRQGKYGNATLSRFPIIEQNNIDLTIGNRKRRGCQYSKILIDIDGAQKNLDIFNLHLGLMAGERKKQIAKLLESNEYNSVNIDSACLVGGDFNDWRSLLRPLFIEETGFKCATDIKDSRGNTRAMKTFPSFSPQIGLDRMYYRGKLQLLNINRCHHRDSKIASDHLPIIAEFELID